MIGNDIVDRAQAKRDSNWQRSGFLDKLFTTQEQRLIQSATDPECMVWLLWSMKESAYKATTRQTGKRIFNPKKISCAPESWSEESAGGLVFYETAYQTKSVITSRYIATIAFSASDYPPPDQLITPLDGVDYRFQSSQLRSQIIQQYATTLSIPAEQIRIDNDQHGSPLLVISFSTGEPLHIPISISHHGRYGAYSPGPVSGTPFQPTENG